MLMERKTDILIASLPVDRNDPQAYARATARLDAALNRMPAQRRACIQDGDDLMFFDHDGIRVGLSWVALPQQSFLILALGAHPDVVPFHHSSAANEVFARALIKVIALGAASETVLWQTLEGKLNQDLLDQVAEHLEDSHVPPVPPQRQLADPLVSGPISVAPLRAPQRTPIQPRRASKPTPKDDVLADLRAAIAIEEDPPSMQMKLSAYALSGAFVFVTPVMGVAMLTYSVLRHVQEVAAA